MSYGCHEFVFLLQLKSKVKNEQQSSTYPRLSAQEDDITDTTILYPFECVCERESERERGGERERERERGREGERGGERGREGGKQRETKHNCVCFTALI